MVRPSVSSATMPARCSRSHGTPANCTAWVTSCRATQRTSSSGSASSARTASARLGSTNSRRGLESGSIRTTSYWPRTRPARKPTRTPTSAVSSSPAAAFNGTRSGPMPVPRRSVIGSSTARIPARFGQREGGLQPGVADDQPLAVRGGVEQPAGRRGAGGATTIAAPAAGRQRGDELGELGGKPPIDHGPMMTTWCRRPEKRAGGRHRGGAERERAWAPPRRRRREASLSAAAAPRSARAGRAVCGRRRPSSAGAGRGAPRAGRRRRERPRGPPPRAR